MICMYVCGTGLAPPRCRSVGRPGVVVATEVLMECAQVLCYRGMYTSNVWCGVRGQDEIPKTISLARRASIYVCWFLVVFLRAHEISSCCLGGQAGRTNGVRSDFPGTPCDATKQQNCKPPRKLVVCMYVCRRVRSRFLRPLGVVWEFTVSPAAAAAAARFFRVPACLRGNHKLTRPHLFSRTRAFCLRKTVARTTHTQMYVCTPFRLRRWTSQSSNGGGRGGAASPDPLFSSAPIRSTTPIKSDRQSSSSCASR